MRYLDPKSDLVFKKVFGEHVNILLSFLNAMLPLNEGQVIEFIEYLPTELVPDIPMIKNSIVDVRCKDNLGRQFIVEMQMLWSERFTSRVLYNVSKTYVKQLEAGHPYLELQPVYALSLVNEIFEKTAEGFYHHFQLAHQDRPDRKLDDFHLVFVEIPKFRAQSHSEKKLMILWMRFMSEIEKGQQMINEELIQELQTVPEIAQALEIAKASGYTQEDLLSYDKFWDAVSREKTLISDAEVRGEEKLRIETVKRLKSMGTYSHEEIAIIMDMSVEVVEKI